MLRAIGGAIARELASRGCVLTLTDHNLLASSEPVDVVVANAGVEIPQDLAQVSEAGLEEAIRIRLVSRLGC